MLNDDQRDYVRSLAKIPPEKKCWCAWFPLGECPHCPPDKSAADRIKVQCPDCGNYPDPEMRFPIVHNIKCKRSADTQAK